MNPKTAIKIMLWLTAVVMLFHTCILLKIIPYEITWGGRLKNDREMYVFEAISLVINLLLGVLLLIKGGHMKAVIPMQIVQVLLWIFLVIFGLNTVGNIIAKTNFEKSFAILTLANTYLIWIILSKDRSASQQPDL